MVLACKSDVDPDERVVPQEEGHKLAVEMGGRYYETSALEGKNTREALEHLASSILSLQEGKIHICNTFRPNRL